MRNADLTDRYRFSLRVHTLPKTPQLARVQRAIAHLQDERFTLPLEHDYLTLPTPRVTFWAHRVPGTELEIVYSILPDGISIDDVRPDLGGR
ncbi:MAG: hypothetical protein ABJE95_27475 [Byssovorax sp.]